ncbi:MAG: hypothetical protein OEY05_15975 [Paracoccaceae bacterium]|nr:hypothetical protein [Paracoccaceae bacterium]
MEEERYRDAEGFSTDVLEAFPYGKSGLACLTVQSNEDRDLHRSQIMVSESFGVDPPRPAFDIKTWIYSLSKAADKEFYIALSGGTLQVGAPANPRTLIETSHSFTKLCYAKKGVYVIGLNGYIGYFDGTNLTDMPVTGAQDIYLVATAPDGTIFACGDRGGLYRRDNDEWVRFDLPISMDIYRIVPLSSNTIIMCGARGFCAQFYDGDLIVYDTPDQRKYFCVAKYRGDWYFGAGFRGLEKLAGNEVVPFKEKVYSYELWADETQLIASGMNRVARFDGSAWAAVDFK